MANIIYKTINKINGKIYVGKHYTEDLNDGYLGSGSILKLAIKKYGKENFVRETLEIVETEELAFEREIFWINELESINKQIGYNISFGGNGFTSEYVKNNWEDPKHKENHSKAMKLVWKDENFRNKMKDSRNLPDIKEKISNSLKKSLNTLDYLNKRSEITKLAWTNDDYRKKTIAAQIVVQNKIEVKEKKSNSTKGEKSKNSIFTFVLKSPNGEIFKTNFLKIFCQEHNLEYKNISSVCNMKRKSAYGWTCISKKLRDKELHEI